tara:strand:- start:856 stop:1152 length:297 start_codon:yes stop_codon:yes gene_type:complete
MTKKCTITKKKPLTGNNVSKAINKTKKRFLPNLQNVSFFSEKLNKKIRLKVTARGIKSVEHNGGIDKYVMSLKSKEHTPETKLLKKNLLAVEQNSSKN